MFQSDASRVNTVIDKPTLVLSEAVLLPMDKVFCMFAARMYEAVGGINKHPLKGQIKGTLSMMSSLSLSSCHHHLLLVLTICAKEWLY